MIPQEIQTTEVVSTILPHSQTLAGDKGCRKVLCLLEFHSPKPTPEGHRNSPAAFNTVAFHVRHQDTWRLGFNSLLTQKGVRPMPVRNLRNRWERGQRILLLIV